MRQFIRRRPIAAGAVLLVVLAACSDSASISAPEDAGTTLGAASAAPGDTALSTKPFVPGSPIDDSMITRKITEKTGKGEIRVSRLALDIVCPDPTDADAESRAIRTAGTNPQVFKDIRARFPGHVSEDSLRNYLIREGFNNIAIPPLSRMCSGLMSRCTTPAAWAYDNAAATS